MRCHSTLQKSEVRILANLEENANENVTRINFLHLAYLGLLVVLTKYSYSVPAKYSL